MKISEKLFKIISFIFNFVNFLKLNYFTIIIVLNFTHDKDIKFQKLKSKQLVMFVNI